MLPPGLTLTVDDRPNAKECDALPAWLEGFNDKHWPGHQPWQPFAVFLRNPAGQVQGGIYAECYGGLLFIKYFFLPEALRRQGLGRRVLAEAEAAGRARGCHTVWLDTFSFQAPEFYRKQGYAEFGRLPLPPVGERIFLSKPL